MIKLLELFGGIVVNVLVAIFNNLRHVFEQAGEQITEPPVENTALYIPDNQITIFEIIEKEGNT